MTSALMGAYRTERATQTATNGHKSPPRTPLLVHAARFAARHLPRLATARTTIMQTGAAAAATWAAWATDPRLGALAAAGSLLALEALTGTEPRQ